MRSRQPVIVALLTGALGSVLSAQSAIAQDVLVSENLGPAAYTASSVYADKTPDRAFDGYFDTSWVAADHVGWIEVDLGTPHGLSRVEMTLDISPDGTATHQVWISDTPILDDTTTATMVYEHTGVVHMHDLFTHEFAPNTQARHLQVRTMDSVGWAAWFEVQVFAASCNDNDADGYGNPASGFCPSGPILDCNDADPDTYPGAPEVCDGYDNDCDGAIDNHPSCDTSCDLADPIGLDTYVTTSDGDHSLFPSLAWNGSGYGLVWFDEGNVYFSPLDINAAPLSAAINITESASDSRHPTIAWNGSTFAVAWVDDRDGNYELYFVLLDPAGTQLIDPVRITNDPDACSHPEIVWSGSEYGIAWDRSFSGSSNTEIFFTRLDTVGRKIGDDTRVTETQNRCDQPSLVWTGNEYGIAWEDRRDEPSSVRPEIYFARLDRTGAKLGDEMRITVAEDSSEYPSVAWTGTDYHLVWTERRDGYTAIYFARLDASGGKIGDDYRLSTDSGGKSPPAIEWTGSESAVAWAQGGYGLTIARIDTTGSVLTQLTGITDDIAVPNLPSLAWNGVNFALAWEDRRFSGVPGVGPSDLYSKLIGCNCHDDDTDGVSVCNLDCDDTDETTYPGAPQICDGLNNDCSHPGWPDILGTNESDDDGDGLSECTDDCLDSHADVYPGAPQVCDGLNNDCDHPTWPDVAGTNDGDDDDDGVTECEDDCDDANSQTYPDAPQACDGVNNDCSDPQWPVVPLGEVDDDGDTFYECQGDCNDADPDVNPEAIEVCNSVDDNCNDLVDEDDLGEDTDADGVHNLCDNCREAFNPDQFNADEDAFGNACDNCLFVPNDQSDVDADDRGDVCDNCPESYNFFQDDLDDDAVGDVCDNCYDTFNPSQSDVDTDTEGDHCDLDDGLIYITFRVKNKARWQEEVGYLSWNAYRGDLDVLLTTGIYTQLPGSNVLAGRNCGLLDPQWTGVGTPDPGETAFFLATGVNAQGESDLGTDSAGETRPNDNACP